MTSPTLSAEDIRTKVAEHLVSDTEVSITGERIAVLTPIYNLERDGVVVWVKPVGDDRYDLSDMGEAVVNFLHEDEGRLDALFRRFAAEATRAFDTASSPNALAVELCAVEERELAESVVKLAQASAHVNARIVLELGAA